jgi:hypothetical protein
MTNPLYLAPSLKMGTATCTSPSVPSRNIVGKTLPFCIKNYRAATQKVWGHAVAQLIDALRYKPEVAGSIPDEIFN